MGRDSMNPWLYPVEDQTEYCLVETRGLEPLTPALQRCVPVRSVHVGNGNFAVCKGFPASPRSFSVSYRQTGHARGTSRARRAAVDLVPLQLAPGGLVDRTDEPSCAVLT